MSHRNRQSIAARISHRLVLLGVLLVTGCDAAPGTDADADSDGVEQLERQLEIGRHAQLVRFKSDPASTLADFASDACSGGLTIGWEYLAGKIAGFRKQHGTQPAWEDCCIAHDRRYHTGGPGKVTASESFRLRREADLELQACVLKTGVQRAPLLSREYGLSVDQVAMFYDVVAELMYRAVRIGGVPCSGLPWRWGYGWPACQ
jgi:hypothetical protein